MQVAATVLSVLLIGAAGDGSSRPAGSLPSVVIPRCLVSLLEEVQVPAQEAGVLVKIAVREGRQVAAEEVLGQMDAVPAEIGQRVAGLQLAVAQERAGNDINVRYARAAADVAKSEYDAAIECNRRIRGTVPRTEVDRLRLTWRRATLQIEQSQHDLKVSGLEAQVREAEVEAAKDQVARRQIRSPLDGVVVKVYCHVGEWVKQGDPVFHVVRMDRLRIEGFLDLSRYAPSEVDGRPVTVEAELSHGRREKFSGRIVFPNPSVQAGREYRVWAEVLNRNEGGHWLLWPGQLTKMTIHLETSQDPSLQGKSAGRPLRR